MKLHLIHVQVTDKHEGENLGHYPLQEGDVVIADRGYNQPKYLVELVGKGIGVVVRYNPQGMNVYDSEQRKIDLYDSLMDTPENSRCIPVRIRKENDYIEGYIHAIRLPPEQTEQARRRLRANAKKEGYTPSDRALFLAGFDSGYFSAFNVRVLIEKSIRAFIASGRQPHNQPLEERLAEPPEPPKDADPVTAMQHRMKTEAGKKFYAKRKSTVEPVFGIIKEVMGFRRFMLRGLEAVKGEWTLVCMAFNLKRLCVLCT